MMRAGRHGVSAAAAAMLLATAASAAPRAAETRYFFCMGELFEEGRGKVAYFSDAFGARYGDGAYQDLLRRLKSRFENLVSNEYGDAIIATCQGSDDYDRADSERALAIRHRRDNGYTVLLTGFGG